MGQRALPRTMHKGQGSLSTSVFTLLCLRVCVCIWGRGWAHCCPASRVVPANLLCDHPLALGTGLCVSTRPCASL